MEKKTINLFEHKYNDLPDGLTGETLKEFKKFLNEVWQKYKDEKPAYWRQNLQETETDEDIARKQPFLYFDDDKKQLKSRNYVGFIKFKNYAFNLYPKICNSEDDIKKAKDMLLLWLQYSDNVILPKIETPIDEVKNCDFIEILIYIFAKYTSDLLSVSIYQHYEEISEETNFLKGKLNFTEYIKNCACGKSHKFHCTYDSFEVNNKFNQIIKYVAKCLFEITQNDDSRNYLIDILHTLDEADDVICTYSDCESVYINRFMSDFNTVLDYCKLFLSNSISFGESGDFDNFAFLLRTELLFEDFISNFAKEQFPDLTIYAQSQKKLDVAGKYNYRPDLIIGEGENKKVIDIKYKDISKYDQVSQADIYQCISYAIKEKCSDVTLLYPDFNQKKENLEPINISLEINNHKANVNISFEFINCCNGETADEIKENIKKQLSDMIIAPQKKSKD